MQHQCCIFGFKVSIHKMIIGDFYDEELNILKQIFKTKVIFKVKIKYKSWIKKSLLDNLSYVLLLEWCSCNNDNN